MAKRKLKHSRNSLVLAIVVTVIVTSAIVLGIQPAITGMSISRLETTKIAGTPVIFCDVPSTSKELYKVDVITTDQLRSLAEKKDVTCYVKTSTGPKPMSGPDGVVGAIDSSVIKTSSDFCRLVKDPALCAKGCDFDQKYCDWDF